MTDHPPHLDLYRSILDHFYQDPREVQDVPPTAQEVEYKERAFAAANRTELSIKLTAYQWANVTVALTLLAHLPDNENHDELMRVKEKISAECGPVMNATFARIQRDLGFPDGSPIF